jgi:hypothetical protein
MKVRMVCRIREAMRHQEFDFPDWVEETLCRRYYLADRDSYMSYRGWSNDWHTILSQVPVSHDDFPPPLRSLPVLCSTLSSPRITKLSHPSLSLPAIIMSYHQVQHIPSTASSQDRQSPTPSQFLISWRRLYSTLYIPKITT